MSNIGQRYIEHAGVRFDSAPTVQFQPPAVPEEPKEKRLDPSTAFVRSLEGAHNYYMLRDAAKMLGVSQQTLRNYNKGELKETLGASYWVYFGKIKIYLYTHDDIDRINSYLNNRKKIVTSDTDERRHIGRPAKWTPEQRRDRQRAYSRAHYYRTRAKRLIDEGKHDESAHALMMAKQITEHLNSMEEAE